MARILKGTETFILVFDDTRKLLAICKSQRAATILTGGNAWNICAAIKGVVKSSGGFYFRVTTPNIEVGLEDLGVLRVEDYDDLCGLDREYCKKRRRAKLAASKKSKTEVESINKEDYGNITE